MRCEEFEIRCHELLDARRSLHSDSHLIAHSLQCECCASHLESVEMMSLGLETWEPPPLSPDFAERAVEAACAGPAAPAAAHSWTGSQVATAWAAAAAALLLTVWLARPPQLPSEPQPGPSLASVAAPAEPEPDWGTWRDMFAQVPAENLDQFVHRLDVAARPLQDVARPITNSFGSTWSALRKTLPVGREQSGAPLGYVDSPPLAWA